MEFKNHEIGIVRCKDYELFTRIRSSIIGSEIPIESITADFDHISQQSWRGAVQLVNEDSFKQAFRQDISAVISIVFLLTEGFRIRYTRKGVRDRNGDYQSDVISFERGTEISNELDKKIISCAIGIRTKFDTLVDNNPALIGCAADAEDHYLKRQSELDRLQSLTGVYFRRLQEYEDKCFKEVTNIKNRLDEEFAKKQKLLEGEYEEKSSELDERAAAMDIMDNVAARRDIRKQAQEKLKEWGNQFELSKGTRWTKRLPLHVLILLFLGVSGRYLYVLINELLKPDSLQSQSSDGVFHWFLLARICVIGIAFFLMLAFYIKWNLSWADRHATEEFRNKRLQIDIDRASWLCEMALEWYSATGMIMPDEYFRILSADMFGNEPLSGKKEGRSFMSSILGNSCKTTLDVAGNKIELDRRGMKKMQKELAEDSELD